MVVATALMSRDAVGTNGRGAPRQSEAATVITASISISTNQRDSFDTDAMKTTIRTLLVSLAFVFLSAAGPKAQAVVPPPDGGYPGFNTAEGQNALSGLTTGSGTQQLVGFRSLVTPTAASTPLSVQGRFFSTSEIKLAARERKTPLLVPRRF